MSCQLEEIIAGLKTATLEEKSETIVPLLDKLITLEPSEYEAIDFTPYIIHLLKYNNLETSTQAAKCIAELTKADSQRKLFTNEDIVKCLINVLIHDNNTPNIELLIQACRALGNICYLNEEARKLINNVNGAVVLINLLDIQISCEIDKEIQFAKVRCGLISNYLLGGEDLAKNALDLKLIDKIKYLIEISINNVKTKEDLLMNILPPLSILTENISDLNFDNQLNQLIAKILALSTNPDLAEMCLELLHYQAENDDVKLLLAKEGLCETIYELLEKYKTLANTNEARGLMKLACDLIVLILTGDESMHYLYSSSLLKYMVNWLDSDDVDLMTTGVLALGNFARSDSHCIYIVENKIMTKLLDILSKNNGIEDDMRLQHALLSALRNLVIPKPNKSAVIEAGLVQTILPMLEIHQPPVVFKLLGTLRMTVDGQDKLALELLKNKTLIKQLVHWSDSSDYPGVNGESFRLMAWLIKHAYHLSKESSSSSGNTAIVIDDTSIKDFVLTDGAVNSMVKMLTSQHVVMQNEALIALSIISTILNRKNQSDINLDDLLIKCELGQKLSDFIIKNSDTMSKEIVENLQTLMSLLRVSDNLRLHFNNYNIDELLKSIPILTEYCVL